VYLLHKSRNLTSTNVSILTFIFLEPRFQGFLSFRYFHFDIYEDASKYQKSKESKKAKGRGDEVG